MSHNDFYEILKSHQIRWAEEAGIPTSQREVSQNRPWVLRPEFKSRNLYEAAWWKYIIGKEHRWARALTSSQCFAVNLFAPLIEYPKAARCVFELFVPNRRLRADDTIHVELEHTPKGAPLWLGERGQPTQVDVCFTVLRDGRVHACLLVEVKLGEAKFGACRGALANGPNHDPSRCRGFQEILAAPERQCWLAEMEERRYWEIMARPGSSFQLDRISGEDACPFVGSLYQLMRNRVLAEALVDETDAQWAEVGVCIHPSNQKVLRLAEAVGGSAEVMQAFHTVSNAPIRQIDPRIILEDAVTEVVPEIRTVR